MAGAIVMMLAAAAQEVTSFPMPFAASSGRRYVPGGVTAGAALIAPDARRWDNFRNLLPRLHRNLHRRRLKRARKTLRLNNGKRTDST